MEYISAIMGVEVKRKKCTRINKLPYYLIDEYDFDEARIDEIDVVFIRPKYALPVANTLKKHISAIKKVFTVPVVLELDEITRQKRKSLLENRIPFVVNGKQIYLPFFGTMLQNKFDTEKNITLKTEKLLPSAQMILFAFIYGECKNMNISEAAKYFNITPMTASRAVRQLNDLKLLSTSMRGRSKVLCSELSSKDIFERAKPYLIDPVRKTIPIDKTQIMNNMFFSGESALAEISMLNAPVLQTYGTVKYLKDYDSGSELTDYDRQCELQFWTYDPTLLSGKRSADILSLYVCFAKEADERIQIEIDELLERLWK